MKQKHTNKKWSDLTKEQREELIKQMTLHGIPKEKQTKLTYQIYEDGTVRGYLF